MYQTLRHSRSATRHDIPAGVLRKNCDIRLLTFKHSKAAAQRRLGSSKMAPVMIAPDHSRHQANNASRRRSDAGTLGID
jgi:hypothetical protein